ncbi:MAG: DNA gyrase inhibitor YacG [Burkholderiales bacterium]
MTSAGKKSRSVPCPQCGKPVIYSVDNKFRPFCSERCKMIDLGAWADETYRIPLESGKHDMPEEPS